MRSLRTEICESDMVYDKEELFSNILKENKFDEIQKGSFVLDKEK